MHLIYNDKCLKYYTLPTSKPKTYGNWPYVAVWLSSLKGKKNKKIHELNSWSFGIFITVVIPFSSSVQERTTSAQGVGDFYFVQSRNPRSIASGSCG